MPPAVPPLIQLARRCMRGGSERSWEELIALLQPVFARVIYRVASQWGYSNLREIDDILQETFAKLVARSVDLDRVPDESEEAALAYFKVMAANCAHDYFRSKYADKRGESRTEELEPRMEQLASAAGLQQIETRILLAQVDEVLDANERDRAVFWLYYRQGLTAREISAALGNQLSDKGVESLLHRLTSALRENLRSRKGASGGRPS